MRPPDLPGGNAGVTCAHGTASLDGFNEAAGFTRRKLAAALDLLGVRLRLLQ